MSNSSDLVLDITKTPQEILLGKFNAINGLNLQLSDWEFGAAEAQTPTAQGDTKVLLSPKQISQFYGSQTLYYTRLKLDEILDNDLVTIPRESTTTLFDLLPAINLAYGIRLTADDIYDSALTAIDPMDPDAEVPVMVTARPESYLYQGAFQLTLNRVVPQVDPDTGEAADVFMVLETPANGVATRSKIQAVSAAGEPIAGFVWMRNTSTISSSIIDQFFVLKNKDLLVTGTFAFEAAIGGPTAQHTAHSMVVSPTGLIRSYSVNGTFGAGFGMHYETQPGLDYVYALDSSDAIGLNASRVYRYGQDGILDTSFDPVGLSYVPALIRLGRDGKLYAASPVYTTQWDDDGNPNTPTVDVKQSRVDRVLPSGALDGAFAPIVIRSTGISDPWPVADIAPVWVAGAGAGLYVALASPVAPSSALDVPIINGVTTVPGGELTVYGVTPVFKFLQSGVADNQWDCKQKSMTPVSVYNPSLYEYTVGDRVIVADAAGVVFFTSRVNPITGQHHRMPVRYSPTGVQQKIAGDEYYISYRWTNTHNLVQLLSGTIFGYGSAKLPVSGGGYMPENNIVVAYRPDTRAAGVLHQTVDLSQIVRAIAVHEA